MNSRFKELQRKNRRKKTLTELQKKSPELTLEDFIDIGTNTKLAEQISNFFRLAPVEVKFCEIDRTEATKMVTKYIELLYSQNKLSFINPLIGLGVGDGGEFTKWSLKKIFQDICTSVELTHFPNGGFFILIDEDGSRCLLAYHAEYYTCLISKGLGDITLPEYSYY